MIAIILRKPDGFGGWTDWGGFTDSDAPVTVDSVQCLPGTITDMGEISNKADFSRGMGALASPPEFQLSVADFAGSRRISAAIFDGTSRFVGWAITLYNSRTRNSGDLIRIGPVNDWRVSDVSSSGDEITFRCMAAWGLNRALIGIGDGDAQVGLCVGPHDVAVKTPEIKDPTPVSRPYKSGNYTGHPGANIDGLTTNQYAQSKSVSSIYGYLFLFPCVNIEDANILRDSGLSGAIAGKTFAETPSNAIVYSTGVTNGPAGVSFFVSESFYQGEDPKDVYIQKRENGTTIAAGASGLKGFIQNDVTSLPIANINVASGILSVYPKIITPEGFASLSLIPSTLQYKPGYSAIGIECKYFGDISNVSTDPSVVPAFSTSYNLSTLEPISTNTFSRWQKANVYDAYLNIEISAEKETIAKFSVFYVDSRWRLLAKNLDYDNPENQHVDYLDIYNRKAGYSHIEGVVVGSIATKTKDLSGFDGYSYYTRHTSFEEANAKGVMRSAFPYFGSAYEAFAVQYEITNIVLYGVLSLSFGSALALVTPGPSSYPGSSTSLTAAAKSILSSIGGGTYTSAVEPDNKLAASFGGEFLEPTLTKAESVNRIAREMWLALSPNSNGAYMIGNMDLIETPPAPLGALEDVVTEPVIEYDLVGTEYKGKAYIANVDQEFDWARYDEFCGGWGSRIEDGATVDYSLLIWQQCRDAYLRHGIKQSETFQMPGLHEAEAIGRSWYDQTRNNVRRIDWLANPPQFITLSKVEAPGSYSWAGCTAIFDSFPAACAGYDVTPYAGQWTLVTDVSRDIRKHEVRMTIMLPPALSAPEIVTYIQTIDDADPVIVQSIETNSDRIVQVIQ